VPERDKRGKGDDLIPGSGIGRSSWRRKTGFVAINRTKKE